MDPARSSARDRIAALESRVRTLEYRIENLARWLDGLDTGNVRTVRTVQTDDRRHIDATPYKYVSRGIHTWQTTTINGVRGVIVPQTARPPGVPHDMDIVMSMDGGRIAIHLRDADGTAGTRKDVADACNRYYRYGPGRDALSDALALLKEAVR